MSEIKQINTGVAGIIAVKVPEGAKSIDEDVFINKYGSHIRWWNQQGHDELIDLPSGNWTPLGLSTELTEEQWSDLFIKGGNESFGELYKVNDLFYAKASKAGVALLKANECTDGTWLVLKGL